MVDSVNNAGGAQNIASLRGQNNRGAGTGRGEGVTQASAADEISVSDAALEAQALEAVGQVRSSLEQDTAAVLSNDPARLNALL